MTSGARFPAKRPMTSAVTTTAKPNATAPEGSVSKAPAAPERGDSRWQVSWLHDLVTGRLPNPMRISGIMADGS